MNKKSFVSSMLLLLAALIWGFAFTAQSLCTDYIGPFTYGTVRFFIGGTVLLPMIPIYAKIEKKTGRCLGQKSVRSAEKP